MGYIVPHSILNNNSFEKLRSKIVGETSNITVIDFADKVFADVANEPMLLLLRIHKDDQANIPVLLSTHLPSQELEFAKKRLEQYSAH